MLYKILEICASGSFGTVVVAKPEDSPTPVALKVMKEEHLDNPKVLKRTRDEARMLQLLDHPNVVKVYELSELHERPVVVMEWIRGLSLEHVIEVHRSGLPAPDAIDIIRKTCLALDAAYNTPAENGEPMRVIHRDIKPANILLSTEGEVKVVDFGIAKGDFEGKEAITVSMVLGSRGFMAPERLDGGEDRPSGDVYAMGLCLFELLTGRRMVLSLHPLHHQRAMEQHLIPLRPPGVSQRCHEELRQIIASMCSYQSSERPAHVEAAEALAAILERHELRPNPQQLGKRFVSPIYEARKVVEPKNHPNYEELCFLERQDPTTAEGAPQRTTDPSTQARAVDEQIRRFLARPRWEHELPKLRELMQANPEWTPEPFLELLDEAKRPWWKFWGSGHTPAGHIVAALQILAPHANDACRTRARTLISHDDPRVARAAKKFLDQAQ